MKYTTFYEEQENLSMSKYRKLKQSLAEEYSNYKIREVSVRKLRYIAKDSTLNKGNEMKFSLCLEKDGKVYLEKKSIQNQMTYESKVNITREMAEMILAGDLEWMKNHKKKLLGEFYLQITINNLRPGYITEYETEILEASHSYKIIVDKEIKRVAGGETDLFGDGFITIRCLDEREVSISYRRKASIPVMISHIIQGVEETESEVVFN
jgi:hypothetical protein